MSLYADIRAGLVTRLSSLGIQSTGYLVSSPTPPTIEVFPGITTYDSTFQRGMDEAIFQVRITVAVSLEEAAQRKLDEYLDRSGSNSVKTLIESDRTLGGVVKDLRVEEVTGHQVAIVDARQVLSATWTVRVYL